MIAAPPARAPFTPADVPAPPPGAPPALHHDPAVAAALGGALAALADYRRRTGVASVLVYRDAEGVVVRASNGTAPGAPEIVPDACLLTNVTGGRVVRPPVMPLPVRVAD